MDTTQAAALFELAKALTFNSFILLCWWLERSERLRVQAASDKHLMDDIDRLLEKTENQAAAK